MYCKEEIERSIARMKRALQCPVTTNYDVTVSLTYAVNARNHEEYARMNCILDGMYNRYGYDELK